MGSRTICAWRMGARIGCHDPLHSRLITEFTPLILSSPQQRSNVWAERSALARIERIPGRTRSSAPHTRRWSARKARFLCTDLRHGGSRSRSSLLRMFFAAWDITPSKDRAQSKTSADMVPSARTRLPGSGSSRSLGLIRRVRGAERRSVSPQICSASSRPTQAATLVVLHLVIRSRFWGI